MYRTPGAFIVASSAVLLLAGCQAPAPPTAPTAIVLHISDYDAFVDASLSVLRRCDYPAQHVDRTRGLIVTRPTTTAQWFEPWRADCRGRYHTLESSLHTIRQIVTVNIMPLNEATTRSAKSRPSRGRGARDDAASARRYRVTVRVERSRHSAPERQVTTASGALGIYSERLPTTEGLRASKSSSTHWVPLGRNAEFETFLLNELTDIVHAAQPSQ